MRGEILARSQPRCALCSDEWSNEAELLVNHLYSVFGAEVSREMRLFHFMKARGRP